jgi:diadenosine tetraphosphate (Ap4A) HIT family hydrolase
VSSLDAPLFASPESFRRGFEQGLEHLLELGGLNLFILVAANATYEASLFSDLRERLHARYRQLSASIREALVHGDPVDEADDDLLVFMKIACIGFEALALTEQRCAGVWEVQFNQLRCFRPLRNSQRPMTSIRAPFDRHGFNFNESFMQQEVLWSGDFAGRHFDLYYNKYPFADLHCLLVPERERCLPQYHQRDMHEFLWQLVQALADRLPGIGVGYNALGAFASVNHLHYQLFVRSRPLPVEGAEWRHNGGADVYPVDVHRFESVDAAWGYVEQLHNGNEAYNLLYTPGGMYCMVRRKQGEFRLAEWSSGFSWYEMSGAMITFNHRDFADLQAEQIGAELACARVDHPPIP